jgi:hypothetical protein
MAENIMSFLQSLFGPSKDEIWQQFAAATGGSFTQGGFLSGSSKVEASHGQWTVVLDTYTVSTGKSSITYTRIRAPYVNPDGFYFKIYRRGIFSNLGKMLGMQDVTIDDPSFDDAFIIQGNDEAKLRRLFANKKIRDLIDRQPDIQFSVRDDEVNFWEGRKLPANVDELYFQIGGVIKDVNQLKLLYDLFSETLDELVRLGSASGDNPGVKL